MEAPKLEDMNKLLDISGNMKDEVKRLTELVIENRRLLVNLEK